MIQSSGLKDASAVICDVPCNYWGCKLINDSGEALTLTIYDSDDATTINLHPQYVIGYERSSDALTMGGQVLPYPVRCFNGIYAALSAETGDYIIYYEII